MSYHIHTYYPISPISLTGGLLHRQSRAATRPGLCYFVVRRRIQRSETVDDGDPVCARTAAQWGIYFIVFLLLCAQVCNWTWWKMFWSKRESDKTCHDFSNNKQFVKLLVFGNSLFLPSFYASSTHSIMLSQATAKLSGVSKLLRITEYLSALIQQFTITTGKILFIAM